MNRPCNRFPKCIATERRGFTLIEVSIVLVIIGLIVGGVLVGQDLIKVVQRQKLLGEWQQLDVAVNTFKLKYNALPGDMANAHQFFGGSSSNNGNGNGHIWDQNANFGHPSYGREHCQFWYLLSREKLIKQEFPECATATPPFSYVDQQTPKLPFNSKTNYMVTAECNESNCNQTAGSKGNGHWIWTQGLYNNASSIWLNASASLHLSESPFTVDDVRWLDKKVDDGHALTGKLTLMINNGQLPPNGVASCADNTASDGFNKNATYPGKTRICHVRSKLGF